eukprot:554673-Hanusia_phi.AAC.1
MPRSLGHWGAWYGRAAAGPVLPPGSRPGHRSNLGLAALVFGTRIGSDGQLATCKGPDRHGDSVGRGGRLHCTVRHGVLLG